MGDAFANERGETNDFAVDDGLKIFGVYVLADDQEKAIDLGSLLIDNFRGV